MRRRAFLASPLALAAGAAIAADYPSVMRGVPLAFPRDFGAHPAFRTEWWYVTGWARDRDGADYGVQVTFFRNRPRIAEEGDSAFAPRQLLFAHAAIADARRGRLLHDQRAARAGFDLAGATEGDTRVWIDDWRLVRSDGVYRAAIRGREFAFDLRFAPTRPVLLQGDAGYSRKGPQPVNASYYYSEPQLALDGTITVGSRANAVTGVAWLDHEWSSEVMPPGAVGWDWTAINLDDGAALMAFRMRDREGRSLWAAGVVRDVSGTVTAFAADAVEFSVERRWRSPRTGVDYPVAMRVRVGRDEVALAPLFDDQELDARASTGTLYWEGAVRARRSGTDIGRGYLELTGYGNPLVL